MFKKCKKINPLNLFRGTKSKKTKSKRPNQKDQIKKTNSKRPTQKDQIKKTKSKRPNQKDQIKKTKSKRPNQKRPNHTNQDQKIRNARLINLFHQPILCIQRIDVTRTCYT